MYLGSAPPGIFPRGDQHCAQGGPAAYSGYRAQKCIADFVRPPPAAPWNGGTQADGGCAETCPVLYYLQRSRRSPRNPAGKSPQALLDPKAFAVGTQQLSLDDFTPKVLPDAAPAVQKLAAAGMPARQAAYEVKQEALQCLTRRM